MPATLLTHFGSTNGPKWLAVKEFEYEPFNSVVKNLTNPATRWARERDRDCVWEREWASELEADSFFTIISANFLLSHIIHLILFSFLELYETNTVYLRLAKKWQKPFSLWFLNRDDEDRSFDSLT